MKKSLKKIHRSRRKFYSQSGEDGALDYVLGKLPVRDSWLVEFGAWDGKHLSNSYHLLCERGYSGVFIEMERDRFETLQKTMEPFGVRCSCLNRAVGLENENKLDNLLSSTLIPMDFDLLSIDIDGDDYHVWSSLHDYRPKIVIIEINNRVADLTPVF